MEMYRITLVVLCTKYTHGFILITPLFQEKCPWNSVKMCSMALVVLSTNYTHRFILISLFFLEECPWNSVKISSITLVCFGPILSMGSI